MESKLCKNLSTKIIGRTRNCLNLEILSTFFDQELLKTLAKRQQVVAQVGNLKRSLKLQPHDPNRWQEVEKNIQATAQSLNLDPQIILKIWELIHLNSLRIERS
ncbi:MAG: chorismate mutase [Flammeovirgaceae bacterium]